MTHKSPLEQTLCLKFCSYYKPGKNEALACRGYLVVERLSGEGKNLVLENNSGDSSPVLRDRLVNVLCLACDFHEQDCDFMQDRAARPCGGFVLLEKLLGSGVIAIEDIH
jgi:hypothetical protein